MGGTALEQQGVITRRASAQEFHNEIAPTVMGHLRALFPGIEAEVIHSYREKGSFGDMDIIADRGTLPQNATQQIIDTFHPAAYVRNGPVFSFEHDGFQIDLIRYPQPVYDFARQYFAFNDLGNLIGRVAHNMGFKFGHDGLHYPLRDADNPNHLISKVIVTQDFPAALTFLGFDPVRHDAGFNQLEDIFEYVVSSPYFDSASFMLENRSNKARTRDRKRPNYNAFLKWVTDHAPGTRRMVTLDRSDHLRRARHTFPAFRERINQAQVDHEVDKRFRAVFNGHRVAALTGQGGKELGQTMAGIVARAGGREALRSQLLDMVTADQVDNYIRQAAGIITLDESAPQDNNNHTMKGPNID